MLDENILIDRAGNFTASENHRLMAGWEKKEPVIDFGEFQTLYDFMVNCEKKPLVGFVKEFVDSVNVTGDLVNKTWEVIQYRKPSVGLVSYAEEKAAEEFFFVDPSLNFSTVHTRNGEERELYCIEELKSRTGLNFVNTGEDQKHISRGGVGCTPDGLLYNELDLIETGAEAKCKSPAEHLKLLRINNNDDLKKNYLDHYTQVQTCMLVTNTTHWHFCCYNPYAKQDWMIFKNIIIKRDTSFISVLKDRLDIAKKIKAEVVENTLKNKPIEGVK